MANYLIIGGDNKEYGPVSEADVRLWISEGRLNAASRVKAESDAEFRALAQFPEFASALGQQAAPGIIAPATNRSGPGSPTDFLESDYELDIMGCFSRSWELVKNNMGLLFVGTLIYLMIEVGVGVLANIPLIGPLFSLANFVCSGPLLGGVFYLFLLVNRSQPAEVGDVFSGFRRGFLQLFLGVLVPSLLVGLCMLPAFIVAIVKIVPVMGQLQSLAHLQPGTVPDPETIAALKGIIVTTLPVALVCMLPATYLGVCWKFTLALIVDQQMDFASAMRASWKMVNKHWWMVFGLIVLMGLLNLAGALACCVGLLFSIPVGIGALMIAYETIFSAKRN